MLSYVRISKDRIGKSRIGYFKSGLVRLILTPILFVSFDINLKSIFYYYLLILGNTAFVPQYLKTAQAVLVPSDFEIGSLVSRS